MVNKASNLMGFHQIDNNKVHRSTFDLGRRNLFTSKVGELLPIFCEEVLPGDTFKVSMSHISRTMPVQTAAFTRLRENVQFFFVPYTSLYYRFREVMQNMTKGQNGQNVSRSASNPFSDKPLLTELPYMTYADILYYFVQLLESWKTTRASSFGHTRFNKEDVCRISDTAKLLMALGYGNFTNLAKLEVLQGSSAYQLALDGELLSDEKITKLQIKLQDYITVSKTAISPFRLLAYHRIIQDYYRYMQWQPWRSYSCNVDYLDGDVSYIFSGSNGNKANYFDNLVQKQENMFDMGYSNLPLDYFNGAIPNQQFGDESVVNLSSGSSSKFDVVTGFNQASSKVEVPVLTKDSKGTSIGIDVPNNGVPANLVGVLDGVVSGSSDEANNAKLYLHDSSSYNVVTGTTVNTSQISVPNGDASLSIIALRKATALQRYKEIQNCHDADFVDQIQAHFGVKPANHGDKSVFLGGYSDVYQINPQVNQNLAGDNDANVKAAPTSQGNGHFVFRNPTNDYGVIIGIYRVTPTLDYAGLGLDRRLLATDAADYPIPELDSIGMQETLPSEIALTDPCYLSNVVVADQRGVDGLVTEGIGYAPRYCEWKISHDYYQGAFLSSLKTWVTGQSPKLLSKLLYGEFDTITPQLFICSPKLCNNIFVNQASSGGIDNDNFMVASAISCEVKRNLSRYGLPY